MLASGAYRSPPFITLVLTVPCRFSLAIAATAGAVNVQLGQSPTEQGGQVPQPMHLRAVVGLVWRTVVMWMVFLALLSLARLLG